MAPAKIDQFFGGDAASGHQSDHRLDRFTPLRIGHTDDGDFIHGRVLHQHLFDLARIDILATADNQVFGAVHEKEIALLVEITQITGM